MPISLPTIFQSPYFQKSAIKCCCPGGPAKPEPPINDGEIPIAGTIVEGIFITRDMEASIIIERARKDGYATFQGS